VGAPVAAKVAEAVSSNSKTPNTTGRELIHRLEMQCMGGNWTEM
jgi:hypothetical protein